MVPTRINETSVFEKNKTMPPTSTSFLVFFFNIQFPYTKQLINSAAAAAAAAATTTRENNHIFGFSILDGNGVVRGLRDGSGSCGYCSTV